MGIFDKIDVSKIPIDEATILDRVAIIIKFSRWKRNLQKSVLHVQSFCLAYFVVSVMIVVALSSLVTLPR